MFLMLFDQNFDIFLLNIEIYLYHNGSEHYILIKIEKVAMLLFQNINELCNFRLT